MEAGSQLQPKLPGQGRRPTGQKASRSSAEPPVHMQTWSLRQEVDRLMQEHNTDSSHPSSLQPKAVKHPVSPKRGRWSMNEIKV